MSKAEPLVTGCIKNGDLIISGIVDKFERIVLTLINSVKQGVYNSNNSGTDVKGKLALLKYLWIRFAGQRYLLSVKHHRDDHIHG